MFRTLGLRHLCVINRHNQILGLVTRSDLVSAHFLTDMTYDLDSRRRRESRAESAAAGSTKHFSRQAGDARRTTRHKDAQSVEDEMM